MKPFETYTPQTACPETREIYSAVTEQMGYLPNVLAQMGQTPPAVRAFVTLNQSFGSATLSRQEQELVQIAASVENMSPYCVAAHTAFATAAHIPMDEVKNLRAGRPLSDPRLEALVEFTRALIREKGKLDSDTRDAFLVAGYTTNQMFEVILGITFKMFSNFAANLATPKLDEAFAPHEWITPTFMQAAK